MATALNGTGTRYLGVSKTAQEREITATLWLTFLFLPILPLKKQRLRIFHPNQGRRAFELIATESIDVLEVFKTYLFGWFVMPVFCFWPLPLAVREVQDYMGVSSDRQWMLMVFALVWIVATVWVLKAWEDRRFEA